MADSNAAGPVVASFVGGFYYRFQVAAPQTRAVRLEILPTGVRVGPTWRVMRFLLPSWAADFDGLRDVKIHKRLMSIGIQFRPVQGKVFEFRPLATGLLRDAVEPVVAALREAGVSVADDRGE